ncbi:hypothetical protein RHOSPDRAFT_22269 [Rhodotorula sp. JG-1b]|nr:hypothetical protein RHOSPDRAFT_22269 [Rhodotorula sp. JG-1b]
MFKRALATTAPCLKPQPTSTPLRRVRDPLLSSRSAEHYTLESGHSFIVRPPPSVVPPTHPFPPQSATDSSAAFAASPFGATISSSSLLLPSNHYSIENQHRLPSTRRGPSTTATTLLSADQITRLQSLRRSDPTKWTRSALAREFNVPQHVVGRFGWGEGVEAKHAERERRRQVEAERKMEEEAQGWKRTIAREERRRRRSMW